VVQRPYFALLTITLLNLKKTLALLTWYLFLALRVKTLPTIISHAASNIMLPNGVRRFYLTGNTCAPLQKTTCKFLEI